MNSGLSWTEYEAEPEQGASIPSLPPPKLQTKQNTHAPEQLQPVVLQGQQGQAAGQGGGGQGGGSGNGGGGMQQYVNADDGRKKYESTDDPKKDISDFHDVKDYTYILIAVLIVDVFVVLITRFYPEIFGRNLNRWYDLFGLSAVIADVGIIVLGFTIARYIYTSFIYPKYGWNSWMFTGTVVGTQLVHDILFYLAVIQNVAKGNNSMIDVFKEYAAEAGSKILAGDALMMIGSSFLAMTLKTAPMHLTASAGLIATYALPYLLFTRNLFSISR